MEDSNFNLETAIASSDVKVLILTFWSTAMML